MIAPTRFPGWAVTGSTFRASGSFWLWCCGTSRMFCLPSRAWDCLRSWEKLPWRNADWCSNRNNRQRKSTTLAAMINLINQHRQSRLSPLKIRLNSSIATVNAALLNASADRIRRVSPKLYAPRCARIRISFLFGEMRDKETIDIANQGCRNRASGFIHGPHYRCAPNDFANSKCFDPSSRRPRACG